MTTLSAMLAYHNDPALKSATISSLEKHAAADAFVRGTYWDPTAHRGCAVGCLTRDRHGGHATFPERWGIPVQVAYLIDRLFEGQVHDRAIAWPLRIMQAIPVGADLSLVWPRFAIALLTDAEHGVIRWTEEGSDQQAAVERVAKLYQRAIDGGVVGEQEWRAAAADAADAAYAADAADAAAAYAADAAAAAAYAWQADLLVQLVSEAPILAKAP